MSVPSACPSCRAPLDLAKAPPGLRLSCPYCRVAIPLSQAVPYDAPLSTLTIIALAAGILSCVPGLGVVAVILAIVAIVSIRGSAGRARGTGLAMAGLVLGGVGTILTVLAIVVFPMMIVRHASEGPPISMRPVAVPETWPTPPRPPPPTPTPAPEPEPLPRPETRTWTAPSGSSRLLTPGVGLEEIVVGKSDKAAVERHYGSEYELVQHGGYSCEMQYRGLGLSFYYKYGDSRCTIFSIAVAPPFPAHTREGIVLGVSTMQDVIRHYGEPDWTTSQGGPTWYSCHPGIKFHVIKDRSLPEFPLNKPVHQARKIVQIDIEQ